MTIAKLWRERSIFEIKIRIADQPIKSIYTATRVELRNYALAVGHNYLDDCIETPYLRAKIIRAVFLLVGNKIGYRAAATWLGLANYVDDFILGHAFMVSEDEIVRLLRTQMRQRCPFCGGAGFSTLLKTEDGACCREFVERGYDWFAV